MYLVHVAGKTVLMFNLQAGKTWNNVNDNKTKYSIRHMNELKAFRGYSWQNVKACVASTLGQNNPDFYIIWNVI